MKPVPRWANWLDLLALASLALAAKLALSHSVRLVFAGSAVTIREAWRPLLAALVFVAVRHWRVASPNVLQRVVEFGRAWRAEPHASIARVWLVSRAGVLAAGLIGALMIGPPAGSAQRVSEDPILDLPSRWDVYWYSGIAREGYSYDPRAGAGLQQTIAFFPAYPMVLRIADAFTQPERRPDMTLARYAELREGRLAWVGTGISIALFLAALLALFRWVERRADTDTALTTVVLISAYPFAAFYSAAYTESLFLFGAVGACLSFERERWVTAGMLGLLVGLTRPNGCMLSLALGVMACEPLMRRGQAVPPRRVVLALAVAATPGIGMLLHSGFIYTLTGDPFAWVKVQQAWGRSFSTTVDFVQWSIRSLRDQGLSFYVRSAPLEILQSGAALFALAMVWPVWRRLGAAYAVFLLANLLPPLFKGGVLSVGRMTATLFPVFAALAMAIPAHRRAVWVLLFALGQGLVAVLFFTWRPLY